MFKLEHVTFGLLSGFLSQWSDLSTYFQWFPGWNSLFSTWHDNRWFCFMEENMFNGSEMSTTWWIFANKGGKGGDRLDMVVFHANSKNISIIFQQYWLTYFGMKRIKFQINLLEMGKRGESFGEGTRIYIYSGIWKRNVYIEIELISFGRIHGSKQGRECIINLSQWWHQTTRSTHLPKIQRIFELRGSTNSKVELIGHVQIGLKFFHEFIMESCGWRERGFKGQLEQWTWVWESDIEESNEVKKWKHFVFSEMDLRLSNTIKEKSKRCD